MAINFPDSPNNGDSFTSNNKTWVFDGTVWNITSGTNSVADGAITAAKLASNAVHQTKLASNLSGITITTTANRDTDITSPFTGQFCFLTDTSVLQRYTGSAWVVAIATAPAAPTALSGTALSTTSVSVAFTPGAENGSTITNYQYALSTDSGSTYGSFLAVDPADATSPITISGLTGGTTYTIKLKAVNTMGTSGESAGVSVTTITPLTVDYLVVAGGAGAGTGHGGGGGAGGLRSTVTATGGGGTLESVLAPTLSTNYTVTVGAGGARRSVGATATQYTDGNTGSNSVFSTITSTGGGGGGGWENRAGIAGGSGGGRGGANSTYTTGGAGTANQGYAGGTNAHYCGGGGGGAGAIGGTAVNDAAGGAGGAGVDSSITGSSVGYAGGGGGGCYPTSGVGGTATHGGANGNALDYGAPGNGGIDAVANKGGGGGGSGGNWATGGAGGSGIAILRYPSVYTITIGAGLTGSTSTVGSNKVTTITAGSGNVSWA